MTEELSKNLPRNGATTSSSTGFLLTLIVATITIWITRYYWKRRRLYKFSANIPGPVGYPLIGNGLKFMKNTTEELFTNITEVFDEYPGLFKVWLGNSLIYMMRKPEQIEIVLNSSLCLEKSTLYNYLRDVLGSGLLTAHVPVWKRHRRLIGPVFNQKLLNGFVSAFNKKTTIFLNLLDQNLEEKDLDIYEMLTALNLDILGDTVMGIELNGQMDKTSKVSEWIDTMMMIMFLRAGSIWYHVDFIFNLSKLSRKLNEAKACLRNFTNKVISEKRRISESKIQNHKNKEVEQKDHIRKTLLDVLLVLSDKGVKLTDREIQEEVEIFLMAGTDTSAVTVGFILSMLGMHPDIQEKVLEEVLDVVGPDGDVAVENLADLKLMDRVIRESLRLFPVGPYIFRRTTGDVDIGDAIIPAHCEILIAIFKVQRDEKYWDNPLKFDPDRFLPEEVAKRHPYTYLPFSAGPRNCIGYRYAMMSMKVVLSKIVRRYVITTSYKTVDEIKLYSNLVLRARDGYKLKFELRK